MNTKILATCPYCGCQIDHKVDRLQGKEIVTCYSEEHEHCERDFVVYWSFEPFVKTHEIAGAGKL